MTITTAFHQLAVLFKAIMNRYSSHQRTDLKCLPIIVSLNFNFSSANLIKNGLIENFYGEMLIREVE